MSALAFVESDELRDTRHENARAARECADWQRWLELEEKAARTREDYLRSIALLLRTFPDTAIEDFTDAELNFLLLELTPPASRPKVRSHLLSFFGWARLTRRIAENPMDYVPRPRRRGQRVPGIFSEAEVALMATHPLLLLLLDTGIRKSEARHLQRRHISLDRGELIVYRGKGQKDRVIPLTLRAQAAVADVDLLERLSPDDYLWFSRPGGGEVIDRSRPVSNGTFHRWYGDALSAVGVAYRNPHTTRHTFATRYLRAGGRLETLRLILGHSSIRTTLDLYAHLDLEDVRRDLALLEI